MKPDRSCLQWDDGSIWERLDKHFDRDTQSGLQDLQRFTVHSQLHQLKPWLECCLKYNGFAVQEALGSHQVRLLREA